MVSAMEKAGDLTRDAHRGGGRAGVGHGGRGARHAGRPVVDGRRRLGARVPAARDARIPHAEVLHEARERHVDRRGRLSGRDAVADVESDSGGGGGEIGRPRGGVQVFGRRRSSRGDGPLAEDGLADEGGGMVIKGGRAGNGGGGRGTNLASRGTAEIWNGNTLPSRGSPATGTPWYNRHHRRPRLHTRRIPPSQQERKGGLLQMDGLRLAEKCSVFNRMRDALAVGRLPRTFLGQQRCSTSRHVQHVAADESRLFSTSNLVFFFYFTWGKTFCFKFIPLSDFRKIASTMKGSRKDSIFSPGPGSIRLQQVFQ